MTNKELKEEFDHFINENKIYSDLTEFDPEIEIDILKYITGKLDSDDGMKN